MGEVLGQLIPVGGGDPIPLLKPQLMVGRRPSCDIQLNYANVSSHHCRLEYVNGYWRATDISTNGTKVDGERIEEKFLQPGAVVAFARHAFEIQYTPDPDAAPPVEDEDPFALSLLEKAGLQNERSERRKQDVRDRRNGVPKPSPKKQERPDPMNQPPDEDDQALEWLRG